MASDATTDPIGSALDGRGPARVAGAQPVAEMPGGGVVGLPFTVVRGAGPGPLVWVIATRDGDEVHATLAALALQATLVPSELAGAVAVVPVVNVPGFEVRSRAHPLAPSFMSEALDRCVFDMLVRRPGFLIDLHSAGMTADTVDWVLHGEDSEAAAGMARAFGAAVVYAHRMGHGRGPDPGLLDGALFIRATRAGVPAILVEAGGGLPPDPAITARTVARVRSVLRHLGVLQGEATPTPEPRTIHGFRIVTPTRGGLMESLVALGDEVREDQPLASIRDLHGDLVEELTAPVAGIVLTVALDPAVGTGSWAFEIGW